MILFFFYRLFHQWIVSINRWKLNQFFHLPGSDNKIINIHLISAEGKKTQKLSQILLSKILLSQMCEKNTSLARAGHGQSVPTVSSILTKLASAQMKKKDIYLIEYKICF